MRYLIGFLCAVALGAVPLVGCGEAAGGGGAGGSAGAGGTAGTGGTGGSGGANTAAVTILASSWEPEQGATGLLEGVQLCETGTSNCVMTDAGGIGKLQLPVDQETSFTVEKEGYASYLVPKIIPAEGAVLAKAMATDARIEDMCGRLTTAYPMEGTGAIFVQLDDSVAGATFNLLGTIGKAFYRDEEMNWSLDLTATTSDGGGGFVEVSPGEYQIEIGGTAQNCVLIRGWPGDSENSVRVPVREGYLSTARLTCDEM